MWFLDTYLKRTSYGILYTAYNNIVTTRTPPQIGLTALITKLLRKVAKGSIFAIKKAPQGWIIPYGASCLYLVVVSEDQT